MREIKFRAWDKRRGQWQATMGNLMLDVGGHLYWQFGFSDPALLSPEESENYVLQQFTGLLDKNDKEIYEGDILRNTKSKEVFEVYYGDMASFEGVDRSKGETGGVVFGPTFFPLAGELEIIGNIYENPELLTV